MVRSCSHARALVLGQCSCSCSCSHALDLESTTTLILAILTSLRLLTFGRRRRLWLGMPSALRGAKGGRVGPAFSLCRNYKVKAGCRSRGWQRALATAPGDRERRAAANSAKPLRARPGNKRAQRAQGARHSGIAHSGHTHPAHPAHRAQDCRIHGTTWAWGA